MSEQYFWLLNEFTRTNYHLREKHPNSIAWLFWSLTNRDSTKFIGDILNETNGFLHHGSPQETQNHIIRKLVLSYSPDLNGSGLDSACTVFWGSLIWFLEREREKRVYVELSNERSAYWQAMRRIFEMDAGTDAEDANGSIPVHSDGLSGSDSEIDSPAEETKRVQKIQHRIKRNGGRSKVFDEGHYQEAADLVNLGHIDRHKVLDNIIIIARQDPRLIKLLESVDATNLKEVLESGLNPKVRDICENGHFENEAIRAIGEDPSTLEGHGVYLHILWSKENPKRFWLYVGQSELLRNRIRDHNKNRHSAIHFSLHYHVWNGPDEKYSRFVTLFTTDASFCKNRSRSSQQLILDLAEAWMCSIFQTLPSSLLDKYLPQSIERAWGGRHLNVASPLWQSLSHSPGESKSREALAGREGFTSFLLSPDPEIREWGKQLREAFNQLRNSPDAQLRGYYEESIRRSTQMATLALRDKARENLVGYLVGKATPVRIDTFKRYPNDPSNESMESICYIHCGSFNIRISKRLELDLKKGQTVLVRFHLSDSEHAQKYALTALPSDPASRLGISVSGRDSSGDFHVWLANKGGEKAVKRANSLVDILEGYTYEERRKFPRRWFSERPAGGKGTRVVYT